MIKTGMRQLKLGKTCLSVLACLAISACRSSTPPPRDICIHDGLGGGDCVLKAGDQAYRKPSEMKNYVCLPPDDMRAFVAWAYDADQATVGAAMDEIVKRARRY